MKCKFTLLLLCIIQIQLQAKIWQVGPGRVYTYCSQVAGLVNDGDTVEIDYALYSNDVQVTWSKNNLYITGVGGRPTLEAGIKIANDMSNGKGIFVVSGKQIRINNIEFIKAKVQSHNGAGIRQEGANLTITNCKFNGNEMGVLSGNISNCKTVIEYCEFLNGGSADDPGYQHNIYINHIDTFIFRYNYTYDALAQGHELKSRANYNIIMYNRISNISNMDSRNIDIPNGGTTILVGNIIEQNQNSANSNILGYGLEGLSNTSSHCLWVCNNTFVNKKTTGSFIHIADNTDTLFVKNNIFSGAKTGGFIIGKASILDTSNNIIDNNIANIGFVNTNDNNYRLTSTSNAIDFGVIINKKIQGYDLKPKYQYKEELNYEQRNIVGTIDAGAYEYNSVSNTDDTDFPMAAAMHPNPFNHIIYLSEEVNYQISTTFG